MRYWWMKYWTASYWLKGRGSKRGCRRLLIVGGVLFIMLVWFVGTPTVSPHLTPVATAQYKLALLLHAGWHDYEKAESLVDYLNEQATGVR